MLKDSEGTNESSDKSAQKKYYYLSKASALSVNPSTPDTDAESSEDFLIGVEPPPKRGFDGGFSPQQWKSERSFKIDVQCQWRTSARSFDDLVVRGTSSRRKHGSAGRRQPKVEPCYPPWLFPEGCVMTKSPFDDAKIKIRCPDCGKTNKLTVGWLRNHSQVACLGCGFLISLRTSETRREILKIGKAWTKLRAALDKIGRKRR